MTSTLAIVVTGFAGTATPTAAGSAPRPAPPSVAPYRTVASRSLVAREDDYARRVIRLVNQRRRSHGLPRVRVNPCVTGFASDWASHLASDDLFEHSQLMDLIHRCDAPYVSENIAEFGPDLSPRRLVSLWMHSPEHRRNILSPEPTATGVGIRWDTRMGTWMAVQNFAKRPGSYPG